MSVSVGAISPAFAKSLVKAQSEIDGAVKGKKNPGFQNSKYADLSACWEACGKALSDNEIAVLQFPSTAPPGYVGLVSTLVYGPTGETLSEVFTCPIKDATNPQALGSALTYSRRYSLCAIIGICPVDDDGNAAALPAKKAAPEVDPAVLVANISAEFAKAFDLDAMKLSYSKAKAAAVPEPAKTAMLSKMADAIKAEKAKESKQ